MHKISQSARKGVGLGMLHDLENKNIFSLYDVSCGYRYQPGISEYRRAIALCSRNKCMLCLLQ